MIRRSRFGEGWPVPPPAISIEGKLGNDQHCAAAFGDRTIHFPLTVGEDPEAPELFCERFGVFFGILPADTKEDAKPDSDFAYDFVADVDPCFHYSLNDGAHSESTVLRR